MPSKEKCAKEWKNLGYKSLSDCTGYKRKKRKGRPKPGPSRGKRK